MPLNSALILTPIRFAATSYVVRVTENGSTQDLTFGGLTIGRNYWMSGDGQADADGGVGGVGDLLTMFATMLTSHSGSSQTFTAALSSFRASWTANTSTFQILWSHANTTMEDALFGFTNSDSSSASTVTSPNQPRGIWRPKKPIQDDSRERQPLVGGVGQAISGVQRVSLLALPKKERDLNFKFINQTQALQEYELAAEPYGSFEEAWVNSIANGYAFRYYPDETDLATNAYQLYYTRSLVDPLKRNNEFRIWWDVALKARAV